MKLKNRRVQQNEAQFSIEDYEIFSNGLQSESGRRIVIYINLTMSVKKYMMNSMSVWQYKLNFKIISRYTYMLFTVMRVIMQYQMS